METVNIPFFVILLKPETDNPIRSHICFVCWGTLLDFHTFYEQAKKIHHQYETEEKGKLIIKEEETPISSNFIDQANDELFENILEMNIEIGDNLKKICEVESDSISADNPLEDTQNDLVSKSNWSDTKNEMHTLQINSPEKPQDVEEGSDNECSEDYDPSDSSDEKESISSEDECLSTLTKKNRKKTYKTGGTANKNRTPIEQSIYEIRKKRKELYKIDEKHADEMILKYVPMGCDLCVFVGKTFPDIVEHFKEAHPRTRPYVTCCDKQFTKRCHLAQHALMHEDPNCFKSV